MTRKLVPGHLYRISYRRKEWLIVRYVKEEPSIHFFKKVASSRGLFPGRSPSDPNLFLSKAAARLEVLEELTVVDFPLFINAPTKYPEFDEILRNYDPDKI